MADEIGWVIVHRNVTPDGPNYWCGNGWMTNNQRAVRFAREIDAQRTLAGFDEDDPLHDEQPHRIEEHMWLDGPRAPSISASPAPSTEGLREALMLAEKADRIHCKCQECEDGAQAPEACEHCFPSADDARVARRNVLKALGVKMRDVDRCAPDAARTALACVTAPSEVTE